MNEWDGKEGSDMSVTEEQDSHMAPPAGVGDEDLAPCLPRYRFSGLT